MQLDLNSKDRLFDHVPATILTAYDRATNAGLNNSNPCTVCRKGTEIPRRHFHGSETGACGKKVLYSMKYPELRIPSRGAFLQDGHLHEEDLLTKIAAHLPNYDIIVAGNGEELITNEQVLMIGHYDGLMVSKDKLESYILECKAVSGTTWAKLQDGELSDEWYGQMQFYLFATRLPIGYFLVKNRETSKLMRPIKITADPSYFFMKLAKLKEIQNALENNKEVPRDHRRRSDLECKFCPFFAPCWGATPIEEENI